MHALRVDDRASIVEELSNRIHAMESGASPVKRRHIFRDLETEKRVVGHCRFIVNLLSYRMRSEHEIMLKLREREGDSEVIDEVRARLFRAELIDDSRFAAEWVKQRRETKNLAATALRAELASKGVHSSIISETLAAEHQGAAAKSDRELCRDVIAKRLSIELRRAGTPEALDRHAATRRIGQSAARKGFSAGMIAAVLGSELDAAGVTWR